MQKYIVAIVLAMLSLCAFATKDSLFQKINNKLNITLGYGYTWSRHSDEKLLITGGHNAFLSGTYHTANFVVNALYINWRLGKQVAIKDFPTGVYDNTPFIRRQYVLDFLFGWNPRYKVIEGRILFGPSYSHLIENTYLDYVPSGWELVLYSPPSVRSAGFTTQLDIKFNICRWFFIGGTINYRYFSKIPHLFSYGLTTGFQYTGKKKQEPKKKL